MKCPPRSYRLYDMFLYKIFFFSILILFQFLATPLILSCRSIQEEKTFIFSEDPIDVVIPCTDKDLDTLNLCIKGIRKNGPNIRRIIIISDQKLTNEAEWFDEKNYPFSKHDIGLQLLGSEEQLERYIKSGKSRLGWIYQQLLKFYAPFTIPDISSNVLVLDSDTIFLNPIQLIKSNGAALFNVGTEYHPPYFQHAARLLPSLRKVFAEHSGISHHMLFQKCVLQQLFDDVEKNHHIPMWQAFVRCIDPADFYLSGASEYEIYFNYCMLHSNQFSIRPLRWCNVNALKKLKSFKKSGFHYVSCHSYSRSS